MRDLILFLRRRRVPTALGHGRISPRADTPAAADVLATLDQAA